MLSDVLIPTSDGAVLVVKAKPASKKPRGARLVDICEGKRAVEISVAAAAVDGQANDALIKAAAQGLSVKRADIAIKSGASGRLKRLEVVGDYEPLLAALRQWLDL